MGGVESTVEVSCESCRRLETVVQRKQLIVDLEKSVGEVDERLRTQLLGTVDLGWGIFSVPIYARLRNPYRQMNAAMADYVHVMS